MGPISPALRGARIANSFAFGLQGFFFAVVLTELPQQKDRFELSDGLIAGSVVLVSILAGVGSVVAEQLATRWSSRATVRIGLLAITITGCAAAMAPNMPVLLATLGLYGIAVGMVDASTNMQAVFIQHGYGTVILSSFYAAWSGGSIVGALFVAACEALDITLRESLLAAAGVVLVVGLVFGPRLLGPREAEARPAQAHDESEASGGVALRLYLAFGIAASLVFAIDLAVSNWSAIYLKEDLLASSSTAALALAVYQGASLIARFTGDMWVRRFGPRQVVRIAGAIGVIGLAIAVVSPGVVPVIIGFLVAGFGTGVVAPLCFSEAGQLASGRELDALIARLNLFNYAGTLVGGGLVGAVAAGFGHRIGFVIPLVFMAIVIMLARVFHSRSEANTAPTSSDGHAVLDT
ncbi:MFS transporter [Nocardia sp. NBC_00565]|uniref:MFS transporter n=1 Tax=Nocardia sp. NBC_00565 TaxID=2975993 RepID=UPI002E802A07|nr:MFS transporter [Nocardia sp. NBC_00565]WUC07277.1 MFS transporter [Nocardia sp. NBC_00565]